MGAMQLDAKKCHAKEVSMTVDAESVEVDRGEARFLNGRCCWSRGPGRGRGGDRCQLRKRVRRTQRCRHAIDVVHDDFNGGELVGPFALVVVEDEAIVSEDEATRALPLRVVDQSRVYTSVEDHPNQ